VFPENIESFGDGLGRGNVELSVLFEVESDDVEHGGLVIDAEQGDHAGPVYPVRAIFWFERGLTFPFFIVFFELSH
jgi:hypothetical protein